MCFLNSFVSGSLDDNDDGLQHLKCCSSVTCKLKCQAQPQTTSSSHKMQHIHMSTHEPSTHSNRQTISKPSILLLLHVQLSCLSPARSQILSLSASAKITQIIAHYLSISFIQLASFYSTHPLHKYKNQKCNLPLSSQPLWAQRYLFHFIFDSERLMQTANVIAQVAVLNLYCKNG